jgi:hypothetical protein
MSTLGHLFFVRTSNVNEWNNANYNICKPEYCQLLPSVVMCATASSLTYGAHLDVHDKPILNQPSFRVMVLDVPFNKKAAFLGQPLHFALFLPQAGLRIYPDNSLISTRPDFNLFCTIAEPESILEKRIVVLVSDIDRNLAHAFRP